MGDEVVDTSRSFWKWVIRDSIINNLYKIPGETLHKHLCDLVATIGGNDPTIKINKKETFLYFRGVRYYSREAGFHELAFDSNLSYEQAYPNEEQVIKLEQLLQHIDELKNERRITENYLAKIFNLSETASDIIKLLPQAAHKYVNVVDANPRVTLSEERIRQIRNDTYKFAHLLNQRILTNLVMKED